MFFFSFSSSRGFGVLPWIMNLNKPFCNHLLTEPFLLRALQKEKKKPRHTPVSPLLCDFPLLSGCLSLLHPHDIPLGKARNEEVKPMSLFCFFSNKFKYFEHLYLYTLRVEIYCWVDVLMLMTLFVCLSLSLSSRTAQNRGQIANIYFFAAVWNFRARFTSNKYQIKQINLIKLSSYGSHDWKKKQVLCRNELLLAESSEAVE